MRPTNNDNFTARAAIYYARREYAYLIRQSLAGGRKVDRSKCYFDADNLIAVLRTKNLLVAHTTQFSLESLYKVVEEFEKMCGISGKGTLTPMPALIKERADLTDRLNRHKE